MSKHTEFYNNNPDYPDSPRGLGNDNWVCFECFYVARLSKGVEHEAKCGDCGKKLICCGSKVKIPPKSKVKAWKELERMFDL